MHELQIFLHTNPDIGPPVPTKNCKEKFPVWEEKFAIILYLNLLPSLIYRHKHRWRNVIAILRFDCKSSTLTCVQQKLYTHNWCVQGTQEKQREYMKMPHSIHLKHIPGQTTFLAVQVTQLLERHKLLHSMEALDLNFQLLLLQTKCHHGKEWGCLPYLMEEVRERSLFYKQKKRLPVILNSGRNKLTYKSESLWNATHIQQ